jgi:hypothetical protein
MSKFDALALAVDSPSRMPIYHPTSQQPLRDTDGNEGYLDLLSADSTAAKKYERSVTDRRLAVRGRSKLTAAELEAEAIEQLVALTKGWHLIGLDGSPIAVDFTPTNARELYSSPAMAWLRDQAQAWIADRANFSKASSTM